jgi:hypothetical protein
LTGIPCGKHFDFVIELLNQSTGGQTLLKLEIEVYLSSNPINQVVVASNITLAEEKIKKFVILRICCILLDAQRVFR